MDEQKKTANHLIKEKSPYLIQHAYNPVDWYPWGEEAFEKARREDKPIFLSVGYSTCHWCHVMEKESFESDDVAEILNRSFIAIKVDREERPDVDNIYIGVCQLMTGSAGWPLSVFMDDEKRPFFAGTYFPKDDAGKRTGFITLLKNVEKAWKENRKELMTAAEKVISALLPREGVQASIDIEFPELVYSWLEKSFDREFGGFSNMPKFPSPNYLLFLMRYYKSTGEKAALEMCRKTLHAMRLGGIYDQVGFGFSRYSTDRKWLVPHFEKMLYDNALLCIVYAGFYDLTGDRLCKRTVSEIVSYLMDRLLSDKGAYYTSEDADSEGVEGKYYVFSKEEIDQVLKDDADEFCAIFGVSQEGNFEGKNILNLLNGEIPERKRDFTEKCRQMLYEYREKRTKPYVDDKILTSQNGLVLAALSIAARITGKKEFLEKAIDIVSFIKQNMLRPDGRIIARYRDDEARFIGYDEDYAFTIWGLIELYFSCLDRSHLDFALDLNKTFIEQFYDEKGGGFFQTDIDSEKLIYRPKIIYDGPTPSANSVAVYNLIRLSRLTVDETLMDMAKRSIESYMKELKPMPAAYPFHASNILYIEDGGTDVVLSADKLESLHELKAVVHKRIRPFTTVKAVTDGDKEYENYPMLDGLPTAYVCRNHSCSPPVTSPEELEKLLG